jgi:hypothetical protein
MAIRLLARRGDMSILPPTAALEAVLAEKGKGRR